MWPFSKTPEIDTTATYMTDGKLDWGKINTPNLPHVSCIRPALCDLDARLRILEEALGIEAAPLAAETNPFQPEAMRHTNRRLERLEREIGRRAN